SAITGAGGGGAPVVLRVIDDAGRAMGQAAGGSENSLPFSGLVNLQSASPRADLAVVARVNSTQYTVEVTGTGAGSFDLGIVAPTGARGLTQLSYIGVPIDAGGIARVVINLADLGAPILEVDRDGDGRIDQTVAPLLVAITEGPPTVLTVRQLDSSFYDAPGNVQDPATYGLLVGVLFDRPVTAASAEATANYGVDANAVVGALLQPSGRLVYLYLQKPVGTFVNRTLSLANIVDAGNNMLPPTTLSIETVLSDGGHVFGQVRTADGQPVPDALLDLTMVGDFSSFTVSRVRTDAKGSFDFDYVSTIADVVITAQHPVTLELARLQARVRAPGEMLLLNPTFFGKGTVRGRVFAADGVTPVPGAPVNLIPSTITTQQFGANANALGDYVITGVPVGTYIVRSVDGTGAFGQATGLIAAAGDDVVTNLVLINLPEQAGRLIGRVFLTDGATPAAGFSVYVGTYDRRTSTVAAVTQGVTDSAGSFAFDRLLAGSYDVVAIDPAT